MIKQLKVLAFFLVILASNNAYAVALNEATVRNFMRQTDAAIIPFNEKLFASFLSKKAKVTLNISILGQKQILRLDKKKYVATVKRGRSLSSDYKYSKSNLRISINNGKALVKFILTETLTSNGRRTKTKTDEEFTIELIAGKLLITEIVSYNRF